MHDGEEESETLRGDREFRLKNLALLSCRTKRWDIKEPGPQVRPSTPSTNSGRERDRRMLPLH